MILAFDENLPPKVAQALALLDFPVTHVLEHLQRGTPDERLFAEVVSRDWVLVTRDANMWRKKGQLEALRSAGAGVFVLVSSAARSPAELMSVLLKQMPVMVDMGRRTRRPFVLRVPDRGKIGPF